jgi:hypothetical protein
MQIIHFTQAAADPLTSFDATGASSAVTFLPLALGHGKTDISCVHIERNASIPSPATNHAAALLVVHGRITVETTTPQIRIDIHAGMGAILKKDEAYSLHSEEGAILVIVQSLKLTAHARAMSTPQRIAGATWPGAETTEAVV